MKKFWQKWVISASSGILGRILLVVFCLSVGFFGRQFISVPIDKDIIIGAGVFIGIIAFLFTLMIFIELPMILQWFTYRRESDNENLQLENENLQLENKNLNLKLKLQEKQSQPDNDE